LIRREYTVSKRVLTNHLKGVEPMGDFNRTVDPKPINGGVLVRMLEDADRTSGGIIIPETVASRPMLGVVEETSDGYLTDGVMRYHEVHIGDVVIFNWKAGFDLQLDDEDFRIIHEREILAILRGYNYG
jgi:chaperonin GroES